MAATKTPAARTAWHFFKDETPKPDACIMVCWEPEGPEQPESMMSADLSFYDGKLFDVNFDEVKLDLTGESVMWAYWPHPGRYE